jgi:hypothetical protein
MQMVSIVNPDNFYTASSSKPLQRLSGIHSYSIKSMPAGVFTPAQAEVGMTPIF